MKTCFTILLMLCSAALFAQSAEKLYGNWIKVKTIYKDGGELNDYDLIKYNYTKFSFGKPDKCIIALSYDQWGEPVHFMLGYDELFIKNDNEFVLNQLRIEKFSADTLILVQQNNGSWDDPACIKFYYVPESAYQKANPLTADDIVSVKGNDTLYKASEKLYAGFNGEASFHMLEQSALGNLHGETPLKNHFLATFIINKDGTADSLKIVEGINPDFDKQYIKTFLKLKNHWVHATHNGKAVSVQMKDEFRYLSSAPDFFDRAKPGTLADEEMKIGNYDLAIINYTKAIKSSPYPGDYYYKRAFCYLATNNAADACTDLQKAKELGTYAANGLIKRFCH